MGKTVILRGVIHGPSEHRKADGYHGVHVTQEELGEIAAERSLVGKPLCVEHVKERLHHVGKVRDTWLCPRSGALCGEAELDVSGRGGKRVLRAIAAGEKTFFSLGQTKLVDPRMPGQGAFGKRRLTDLSVVSEPARREARILSVLADDDPASAAPLREDREILNYLAKSFQTENPVSSHTEAAVMSDEQATTTAAGAKRAAEEDSEPQHAKRVAVDPSEHERQREQLQREINMLKQLEEMTPEEVAAWKEKALAQLKSVDEQWIDHNAETIKKVFQMANRNEEGDKVVSTFKNLARSGNREATDFCRQLVVAYSERDSKLVSEFEQRYQQERERMQKAAATQETLKRAAERSNPVPSIPAYTPTKLPYVFDVDQAFEGIKRKAEQQQSVTAAAAPASSPRFSLSLLNDPNCSDATRYAHGANVTRQFVSQ